MNYDDDRDLVDFISGLLLGALIGAGVALLVAPRSGRSTRRRIVRLAEEWGEAAGESLQRAADDARRLADRAREKLEDSGDRLAEAVEKGRKLVKV